jgi:hypothetical protein
MPSFFIWYPAKAMAFRVQRLREVGSGTAALATSKEVSVCPDARR